MRLKFHDRASKDAVIAYIEKCKDGKEYTVEIKRHFPKRTLPQNSLYWLYIGCIQDETGNDRDAVHDTLREMFLPVRYGTMGGKETKNLTSTRDLDTKQFGQYIDKIVAWAAAEEGIILPDPEDKYFEMFYEQYKDYI